MKLYHGTSSDNLVSILQGGFSLESFTCGSLGKGIYFARDKERCTEYGNYILEVEIAEEDILKADFNVISSYILPFQNDDTKFMAMFRDCTESKGYKALELGESREIVVYDLSCILFLQQS